MNRASLLVWIIVGVFNKTGIASKVIKTFRTGMQHFACGYIIIFSAAWSRSRGRNCPSTCLCRLGFCGFVGCCKRSISWRVIRVPHEDAFERVRSLASIFWCYFSFKRTGLTFPRPRVSPKRIDWPRMGIKLKLKLKKKTPNNSFRAHRYNLLTLTNDSFVGYLPDPFDFDWSDNF
jgi:hypothetical protein